MSDLQALVEEMKLVKDSMIQRNKEFEEKTLAHEKRLQGLSQAVEANRYGTATVKNGLHKIESETG